MTTFKRKRQEDWCKLEPTLFYIVSSRPVRATWQNILSKYKSRASDTVHWVKVLITRPDYLNLIPGVLMAEGKDRLLKVTL